MADDKPNGDGKKKSNGGGGAPASAADTKQEKLEKAGEAHRKAAQDYEGEAAALGKTGKNGDAADRILKSKEKAQEHWDKAGQQFNRAGDIKLEKGELRKALELFGEAAKCYAAGGSKEKLEKKKKTIEITKGLLEKMEEQKKEEEKKEFK